MPASPADSQIYRGLFGDDEAAALFTDSAEIRAMLLVEGTLAKVQGELGLIPAEEAAYLHRAAFELQIDPSALAHETSLNGVPVLALLAAMRKAGAADQMHHLHWGATSQDIMDTALALRLRRLFDLWQARLDALLGRLADLADAHADLPMAARTYGQYATPTSFGAVVAGWGWPAIGWREDLPALRDAVLQVSLSGAAGTLSAMGPEGPAVRAGLAHALGLVDPGHAWHSDRSGMARLAGFAAGLAGSLGKLGEDLILLTQSGIDEVSLVGGGSSTMPQKQNPVAPSALVALSRQISGLAATLQSAALHRQQRDGAAWFTEWLTLPQLCLSTSRLLSLTNELLATLRPEPAMMARPLTDAPGLIHAEAVSFALAAQMPRPDAQAAVKALCKKAQDTGTNLIDLAATAYPGIDWSALRAGADLGQAPAEARAFATRARRVPV
jgi:3-carboxy-cis,cis-muconate cycloisomerase